MARCYLPSMINSTFCICGQWVEYDTEKQHKPRQCPACATRKKQEKMARETASRQAQTEEFLALGGPGFKSRVDRAAIRTRAEVAKLMGISEEAVRLSEQSALLKLMKAFKQLEQLPKIV
jgi:hypothetical protein